MTAENASEPVVLAADRRPGLFACGVGVTGMAMATGVAVVVFGTSSGDLTHGLVVATLAAAVAGRLVRGSY